MITVMAPASRGPERPRQEDTHGGIDERRSRARRNALLLALLAVGFYAGFILLGLVKGIFPG